MNVRGAIAWKIHGFTIGIYNHNDSFPTILGERVWTLAQQLGADGLVSRLKQYGDWEEFENAGVCRYCGKVTGQPVHVYSGKLVAPDPETGVYKQTPDPDARYHEHGNSSKDQIQPFKHAHLLDWVYVVDHETNSLEVWFSVPESRVHIYRGMGLIESDSVDADGYTHILIKTFDLSEDAPNWPFLEHEVEILKRGTDGL